MKSDHTEISSRGQFIFGKVLYLGKTDRLEVDDANHLVYVVNQHGKIKDRTTYKYQEPTDGQEIGAGAREDTRGLGQGSSQGNTEQV